jgi:hypothetical protein
MAFLAPLVLLALLAGNGCVVSESDADLSFYWNYEGQDCLDAGVSRTLVQVWDGDYLEHEEYVPCDASGVTLYDFATGDYQYYVAGLSPNGTVLYDDGGVIHADGGNNVYNLTLYWAGR